MEDPSGSNRKAAGTIWKKVGLRKLQPNLATE
jgi:hypothetical protein